MGEFDKKQQSIAEKIKDAWDKSSDPYLGAIAGEVVGKDVQSQLVELFNPTIFTPLHKIVIPGKVFLTSTKELIKVLKARYTTPGSNIFPEIVDDFLKSGKNSKISQLNQYDSRQALQELHVLQRIVSQVKQESVVFLTNVDPISPVSEYIIDGRHTSGTVLRSQETPIIVLAKNTAFKFDSILGAKISDGRLEKNMVIDLTEMEAIIHGVEDNIVVTKQGESHSWLGNILSVLVILLLGAGMSFLFSRRGNFVILGIPMVVGGAIIFYLRFLTGWGREYFVSPEKEIYGEAPLKFQFHGMLK